MKKYPYPFSKAALASRIQKLRLEKGDIVVCMDEVAMHALAELPKTIDFMVPLVFAPQGLRKLNRQDLLNLLEQLEEVDKSVLPPYSITEQPGAPL